jgi:hypothetical protein
MKFLSRIADFRPRLRNACSLHDGADSPRRMVQKPIPPCRIAYVKDELAQLSLIMVGPGWQLLGCQWAIRV